MSSLIDSILRTILIIIVSVIGLRFLVILMQRVPGVVVALSIIAIGVFLVALYKGSFKAIGLKNRRSIVYAIIISILLFLLSGSVLVFVER